MSAVCDVNIWMNGIIISSLGIGCFITAFLLNATLRRVNDEAAMSGSGGDASDFKTDSLSRRQIYPLDF